jgi:hypothetical protein
LNVQPTKPVVAGKGKITTFWKDAREYAEHAEEVRMREVEEK